ncbi:hypothetical protein [Deinococcus hohokamensis]|uniref:DUF304 domain-containing protein n=1 Tax=Deinococcus hohokamensis TaxID=309883 RepID=A0ABV9ID05_9DEIO
MLVILLLAVAVLSRLITQVKGSVLTISLGLGLFPIRVPIQSIRNIQRTELNPFQGYGLRLGLGVRIYRIRGQKALQLTLRDERYLIVAGNDLGGLEQALQHAWPAPSSLT